MSKIVKNRDFLTKNCQKFEKIAKNDKNCHFFDIFDIFDRTSKFGVWKFGPWNFVKIDKNCHFTFVQHIHICAIFEIFFSSTKRKKFFFSKKNLFFILQKISILHEKYCITYMTCQKIRFFEDFCKFFYGLENGEPKMKKVKFFCKKV